MSNIFAELQQLANLPEDSTIAVTRRKLNKIVEVFKQRDDYEDNVITFAKMVRALDPETCFNCDSFMVQPDVMVFEIPEELRHDSLGFCRGDDLVFSGRYVYPVKDNHGDVMGFCGYDKFSDVKYLDSKNYGYQAKSYTLWGMECLPTYYRNDEPVFFVEGIVCALYLRQCGLQSLATLGSNFSPYVLEIVKRFGMRSIIVNDADEAGSRCRSIVQRKLPYIRCVQSTLAKDVDDSRQVNEDFVHELAKLKNPFYRSTMFK